MREIEIPLRGGRVTGGVVRVGATVRRPIGAHSRFVHELLTGLARLGFEEAPGFLGIDDTGREVLSLLPGSVLSGQAVLGDEQIVSAAALLRRYHDAAAQLPRELLGGAETVVHGDPGPWNLLWLGDRAVALIDFDEARPGPRLDDVGYFAWKGLRLVPEGPRVDVQRQRLALLAEAYGVDVDARLLDAVESAATWLRAKGEREGWSHDVLSKLNSEREWLRRNRAGLGPP